MSFKNLERRLTETGQIASFSSLINKLNRTNDDNYATTLSYVLSVINDFDQNGTSDYAAIGGYAVLFHIIDLAGEQAATLWRGSDDFDFSAKSPTVESILRGQYGFQKTRSHFDDKKLNISITDEELKKNCTIDLYMAFRGKPVSLQEYEINDGFWKRVQTLKVYGLPVPVASKIDLTHMKLAVKTPTDGMPRTHDINDLFNLFGLISRESNAKETWDTLTASARIALSKILEMQDYNTVQKIGKMGLLVPPSKAYLKDLKHLVKNVAR